MNSQVAVAWTLLEPFVFEGFSIPSGSKLAINPSCSPFGIGWGSPGTLPEAEPVVWVIGFGGNLQVAWNPVGGSGRFVIELFPTLTFGTCYSFEEQTILTTVRVGQHPGFPNGQTIGGVPATWALTLLNNDDCEFDI